MRVQRTTQDLRCSFYVFEAKNLQKRHHVGPGNFATAKGLGINKWNGPSNNVQLMNKEVLPPSHPIGDW